MKGIFKVGQLFENNNIINQECLVQRFHLSQFQASKWTNLAETLTEDSPWSGRDSFHSDLPEICERILANGNLRSTFYKLLMNGKVLPYWVL